MPVPPADARRLRDRLTAEAGRQPGVAGVLTRADLLALGWTDRAIAHRVALGGWGRPARGLVTVHGPEPSTAVRVAWVAGGRGAIVGGLAAGHLVGLVDDAPPVTEIQVPHGRVPERRPGTRYRHTRRRRASRPLGGVLVTTVEETVLDLVGDARTPREAVAWVERALGRRLTTPDRLLESLELRHRLRHRRLVVGMCVQAAHGRTTFLERWFAARVMTAHGLPRGQCQVRRLLDGRPTYSDVEIEEHGVVIELDGRVGHEDEHGRFRDRRRDNAHAVEGRVTLRYGWVDAVGQPCDVAAEVGRVLRDRGWGGRPHRCGPACAMP